MGRKIENQAGYIPEFEEILEFLEKLQAIQHRGDLLLSGWTLLEKEYMDVTEKVYSEDGTMVALINYYFLNENKDRKIKGRIVTGHNEVLFFWQELITKESLETPFEVVHIDSHADLGLGYLSWTYILDEEKFIWDKPVENTIQLVCNPDMEFPSHDADKQEKQAYLKNAVKEPEVPLLIIPSIQDVKYDGEIR